MRRIESMEVVDNIRRLAAELNTAIEEADRLGITVAADIYKRESVALSDKNPPPQVMIGVDLGRL